ncbi:MULTISPECIES: FAD:protein FMN transferase [Enterobacteriaceae]|uniref:FAD:protein FMN transferase n=1 Tax=Kluyvera genomosp. 2 TaxID=2774054 RepID=A0A2T2XXG6_9ENTR|nr:MULTISPECIES: FAD:protein FMN transferase [Enterobacteriaceae]HAT3920381.1 FAD:protein FMN transferase [Kluyvera ascorbata]PSR44937.1 thiamine biosynthesis protein ApbE [Kluyvera genomosp. 2]BBQ83271.1 FAD:protein FMN transferase [Klebsiella sp. WP3-W18-ESBL-02]BBR20366.1 FAD:protein FMN transferase [Klebsiella sp. WP3-S18-ESBL-05]BBR59466.1 FAD:protein FMN transferase [Klebsiella sp. WP4-W18-ESBL-05]
MSDSTRVYSYSAVLMGSPILLKLFAHDEALASRVFRLIKQYEDLLTVNRAQSQVMDINHAAGQHAVAVSSPVYALIKCAKAASLLPQSAFNLAIGPLVKRWRIGFRGDSVPPADEIARLLTLTDPRQVVLNDADESVYLTQPGMEIDLGAIAKGYIADRVRDYLHKEGIAQGLINLGGNVQTLGSPEGGWSIGLKKPFSTAGAMIGALEVANKSVVTSGVYERFFEHNGHLYHHILDPRTGYPLDNELDSVTIISSDSIDGDIWTTLMYGMGVEKGCAALRARPDIEAIFVTRTKEVVLSSAHHYRFTLLDSEYRLTGSTV